MVQPEISPLRLVVFTRKFCIEVGIVQPAMLPLTLVLYNRRLTKVEGSVQPETSPLMLLLFRYSNVIAVGIAQEATDPLRLFEARLICVTRPVPMVIPFQFAAVRLLPQLVLLVQLAPVVS